MQTFSYSVHFGSPEEKATKEARPFKTNEEAKAARDEAYKKAKAEGKKVKRSVLNGQSREYWGWGEICGIIAPCYELTVWE